MSIAIQPQRLRAEMARRALSGSDLARAAGVGIATVSTALAGRPIASRSLSLIVKALTTIPPDAIADVLLDGGDSPQPEVIE
jgi:transcriptional regulator with XRE-family HTH domain